MTIYELDDILALMDWDKICTELEKCGFRQAEKAGEYEFKPEILKEQSGSRQSAIQKDVSANKEYYGILYRDNKVYKGVTFVWLILFVVLRDRNHVSVPRRAILFTDAPYNAKYVKAINSPYRCDNCGTVYIKKELCEHNGKFLCDECLIKAIDEDIFTLLQRKQTSRLPGP